MFGEPSSFFKGAFKRGESPSFLLSPPLLSKERGIKGVRLYK